MTMISRSFVLTTLLAVIAFKAQDVGEDKPTVIDSRWVKLDNDGRPMDNWSGPWSCILDKNTGLIWENKDINEGIHDANWTYSWLDEQGGGVENRGDCNFDNNRCDTLDIIEKVRQEQTCGLTKWRLPTAKELHTLINLSVQEGYPVIDTDFFPFTKRSNYWSADGKQSLSGDHRFLKEGASAVNFIKGEKINLPYRNAAYVRLVTSE